jgi:hypothetical protein
MEGNVKKLQLHEPRALVLCFPYRERRNITKEVTLYDLAPTIMEELGVDYKPTFPFGAHLFSEKVGRPPSLPDFQMIYNMMTTQMGWDGNITCRGGKGFCTEARS